MVRETKVFGLTGGICCGKSTASKLIAKANIPIIDADQVARDVVAPGSMGLDELISAFGNHILQEDGQLNRLLLGSIVFSDKEKLNKLNSIMFPLIETEVNCLINIYRNAGVSLICYDAAILIETGNADKYRPLIVISCSPETQLTRLMKRNSLSEKEAWARINAQMSSKEKEKYADFIVNSDCSLEQSQEQILSIISQIKKDIVS